MPSGLAQSHTVCTLPSEVKSKLVGDQGTCMEYGKDSLNTVCWGSEAHQTRGCLAAMGELSRSEVIEVAVDRATGVISLGVGERLKAVLSGSFRTDATGLRQAYRDLQAVGCEVLSPSGTEFVAEVDGFVFTPADIGDRPSEIEERHLKCMRAADFVWLHAPDGYVGASASLEIGYAHALGLPVFADVLPADASMSAMVHRVESVEEAWRLAGESAMSDPGRPLRALQDYYATVANRRGYDRETAQDTMLLLTEELGELARAVRKYVGLVREGGYDQTDVGEEIADVQLYLVHLANVLGADIAKSVTRKERINSERSRQRAKSVRMMA